MRKLAHKHAWPDSLASAHIAIFLAPARHRPTVTYMMDKIARGALRRISPRVRVETFCTELQDDMMRHAIVTDLGSEGLRLIRPLGARHGRTIPIEFEIPEIDEVVWALGQVCFDEVKRAPPGSIISTGGMIRSTGLRLVKAAQRHKRILREFVMDSWCDVDFDEPELAPEPAIDHNWLMSASCYRC